MNAAQTCGWAAPLSFGPALFTTGSPGSPARHTPYLGWPAGAPCTPDGGPLASQDCLCCVAVTVASWNAFSVSCRP